MKKWQKVLTVIGSLLVVALIAGFVFIKSLGNVTVPKFEKISENTYAYSEGLNKSNMYLLLGEERAMLIDTANGLSDIPAGIEEITDLPVFVVSTHGHYDHIRGNHYFEERYMSVKDDETFSRHRTPEEVKHQLERLSGFIAFIMKYQNQTIIDTYVPEDYRPLPEEGYFDLGNRRLEIIELPGHTPGSIGLLDTNSGELFCGDAITPSGVLLHLQESLPVSTEIQTLDTVQEMIDAGKVTALHGGHGEFDPELVLVRNLKEGCEKVLSGDVTDKEKEDGRIYYEGLEISFDLDKVY